MLSTSDFACAEPSKTNEDEKKQYRDVRSASRKLEPEELQEQPTIIVEIPIERVSVSPTVKFHLQEVAAK